MTLQQPHHPSGPWKFRALLCNGGMAQATSARSRPLVARVAPQVSPRSGIAPGTHEPHEPHAPVLNHAQSRNRFFVFPGRDPAPETDVDRRDVGWVDGWWAHAFQLACPHYGRFNYSLRRWAGFDLIRPSVYFSHREPLRFLPRGSFMPLLLPSCAILNDSSVSGAHR